MGQVLNRRFTLALALAAIGSIGLLPVTTEARRGFPEFVESNVSVGDRLALVGEALFGAPERNAAALAAGDGCGWWSRLWGWCGDTSAAPGSTSSQGGGADGSAAPSPVAGVPAAQVVETRVIERVVVRDGGDESAARALLERLGILEQRVARFDGRIEAARESVGRVARDSSSGSGSVDVGGAVSDALGAGDEDASLGTLAVVGAATSTFANGLDISDGCFAVDGVCLTSGSGADGTFSTSSAAYLESTLASRWSTTSSAYWESTQTRWATSASDYWDSTKSRWSTSSSDYWESIKTRWSTSSSDAWVLATSSLPHLSVGTSSVALSLYGFSPASYLSLANWYATTTSALAEGANLYYTPTRVASVIAGTTTDALAEGSANRYYTDARVGAYVSASSTVPHVGGSTYGDVLYWTGSAWARAATSSLNVLSTDVREGSNLFYTDARVNALLNASSTLAHPGGAAYGNLVAWSGSVWTAFATSSLGVALADTVGTLAVSRGGTNATSQATNGVAYYNGSSVTTGSGLVFDGTSLGVGTTTPGAIFAVHGAALVAGTTTVGALYATGTSYFGGSVVVGGGTPLSNSIAHFGANANSYAQVNVQNRSAGSSASSDFVATSDDGDDTKYYIDLGINGSGYSNGSYTIGGARDGYLYTSDGALSVGTASTSASAVLKFNTGGTLAANERMRITSTGLVGVGTTSPYARLSVHAGAGDAYAGTLFSVASSTVGATSTHFAVLNSGYVGIGSAAPNRNLVIATNPASDVSTINFSIGNTTMDSTTGALTFRNYSAGIVEIDAQKYFGINFNIGGYTGSTRTFKINYGSSATNALTIVGGSDQSNLGYVGVGTTSPYAKLSVAGQIVGSHFAATSTAATSTFSGGVILASGGGRVGIGTTTPAFPLDVYSTVSSNQTYGYLNSSGAVGTSAGTNSYSIRAEGRILASEFNAVSDARLKDVQFDLDSAIALDAITRLQPVSFTWKDNPTGQPVLGFLAQDVEAVIPNAVSVMSGGKISDQRELSYNQITAVLVGAVKEVNVRIEGLAEMEPWTGAAEPESFAARVVARIAAWLGDAGNGLAAVFAGKVQTDELCLAGANGSTTCITREQLNALLSVEVAPEPEPEPETETTPEGGDSGGGAPAAAPDDFGAATVDGEAGESADDGSSLEGDDAPAESAPPESGSGTDSGEGGSPADSGSSEGGSSDSSGGDAAAGSSGSDSASSGDSGSSDGASSGGDAASG